jgi:general L-amino acid transport system permease protein
VSNTDQATLAATQSQRPPFYRDVTVVKWLAQVFALLLVVFALFFLTTQALDNLGRQGIELNYDFLGIGVGSDLREGIDTDPATALRMLLTGAVNTIRIAAGGIIAATILGVLVGVGRLSSNWIVSRICSVFVETIRNIPLLVQIVLIWALVATLPDVELDQGPIKGLLHLSNKGVSVPRVHIDDGFYQWLIFIALGSLAGWYVKRRRERLHDATGRDTYPVGSFLGVLAVFGAVGWVAHPIFGWVGAIFESAAWLVDSLAPVVVAVVLGLASVTAAALWIWRFLERRRTPAGLMKLSDDDWFRIVFAAVGSLAVVALLAMVRPGLSGLFIDLLGRGGIDWARTDNGFFGWLADKFGDGRTGPPIDIKRPDIEQLGNFPNPGPAGLNLTQGGAAVFFGVVLYTASFVAEIVRGGILAVPKGQTEAAQAVGLRRVTMLRRVVLPQAFRVILPPLGNQYLNLTKNTSLAIAVGYTDFVQVGQIVYNQTGKTLEVISLWMLFYLACSLTISVVVNFFNIRMKIVER